MKKILCLFLVTLMITAFASISAVAETSDGLEFTLNSDGTYYTVSGYTGTLVDVVIPSEYEGLPVKEIGNDVFQNCTTLASIDIPNTITKVGSCAFLYCTGLTTVNISDLAAWCDIDFYSSNSNPLRYGGDLYLNGELITELVIPDSVTAISDYAFCYCGSLTSVTIPDSVVEIGEWSFYSCSNLTSVTIPNSVTKIGEVAFSENSNLTTVNISDLAAWCKIEFARGNSNPLSYGGKLYLNGELVTDLVIPDSVTKIGDYAFYGCGSLTSAVIPDSVTEIGGRAFYGCSNLISVTIPDSVTIIGDSVFYQCAKLSSVTLPDNLTVINQYTFGECVGLTEMKIPDSVTAISRYAFYNCKNLSSVDIGKSVTSIGEYAFNGCNSLASIIIPSSMDEIGERAFYNCEGLSFVIIEGSLSSIVDEAFQSCDNLQNVIINGSVDSIAFCAFSQCKQLKNVTINGSVTTIAFAFSYCDNLTSVTIGGSVTNFDGNVFSNCRSLKTVTIGGSVTEFGVGTFGNCSSLTSVTVGGSVTDIGYRSFIGCGSLTSVTVGGSVTKISGYAFSGCSSLISIPVSDSVSEIGGYAFDNCSSLISVTIPESVTKIEDYAFNGCTALADIYCMFEEQPEEWGGAWLEGCSATVHWNKSVESEVTEDSVQETPEEPEEETSEPEISAPNPEPEFPEVNAEIVTEADGTLAYYVDGVKQYGCGLVYLDGYYYHVNSSGVVAVGEYWVSNDNGYGYTGVQQFGEDGKMVVKDGIVTEADGTLAYYIKNVKQSDSGLIRLESGYYYVNSSGTVVTGDYWITKNNGYGYYGCYTFDETGRLIIKNGIYEESDGTLAYYHYNIKQSDLGLIYFEGYYYYVNSNAQVMTGEYWVSKDNYYPYYGLQNFDENGRLIIE